MTGPAARRSGRTGHWVRWPLIVVLVLGFIRSGAAAPEAPTAQVRVAVDEILALLRDRALTAEQRRERIRAITDQTFDRPAMARRALGRHWDQRTRAEQAEFVGLFRDLIERTYITRLEHYSGERVDFLKESIEGDEAVVYTSIVRPDGTTIPVDYWLARRTDRWRVFDVLIEHVSLIANYRSQFNDIISNSSYRALVGRIEARLGQGR